MSANPEDWGGLIFLALFSLPVIMLLNAADKLKAIERDQRRAERRARSRSNKLRAMQRAQRRADRRSHSLSKRTVNRGGSGVSYQRVSQLGNEK